jgi:hypothetical protein
MCFHRIVPIDRRAMSLLLAAAVVFFMTCASSFAKEAPPSQASYKTPEAAVDALIAAAKSSDAEELVRVLGPEGSDIVDSGDPVLDASKRAKFVEAYEKAHSLQAEGDARSILIIGENDYPFPIPLVAANGSWHFDTPAGAEEILNRRIGENELATIEAMLAFVDAQQEYASIDRDGKGLQYARRLLSRPGKRDGLYWPNADGESASPLGILVAQAKAEGYRAKGSEDASNSYHGYVFKMLSGQGAAAAGGARKFTVRGRMIGGFGLVATPVKYGNSGVMTFIVNQDGVVYERDLGPDSRSIVADMSLYNPDKNWQPAKSD